MTVIKQGAEPVAFKSYFVAWEPQMWNKKMSYEDQMKAIKQDNDKVDENAWSLTEWNEKLKPKNFPLEVLQRKGEDLPEGVDPTKKEMHLDDDKFEEMFKMSKNEWEKVPQWKKNQCKKSLDLF
ncbi:Villin-1 [Desmophyllum pertusum]|uniref:Villin-1 n=1 Tax=Desmophyllum pertusum TaxID=174260 RepID=A0A9W9ZGC0_9CNID|nr:Villin-1 [Desmophyllum pertusum]